MKLMPGMLFALTLAAAPVVLPAQTDTMNKQDAGPTYRLSYTVTDLDAGKRVGVQHFSITVNYGTFAGRGSVKIGNKIPIITGTYTAPGAKPDMSQTQFTYLDVGLNVDARVRQVADGVLLTSKIEQSSAVQNTSTDPMFASEPIVRQSVLENTAVMTPGKPVVLGALDVPGSTHHVDLEVVLETVK